MTTVDQQFKRLGIAPVKCKTNISYKTLNSSDKVENSSVDILHLVDDINEPPLIGMSTPSGLTPPSAAQQTASTSLVAEKEKERGAVCRTPRINYLGISRRRHRNTNRVWFNVSMRHDQLTGPGFQKLVFKLTPRRDEFAKNIDDYNLWPYYTTCYETTRGTSRTILIGKGLEGKKWGKKRTPDVRVPRTAMSLDLEANLVTIWIEDQCFRDIELEPTDNSHFTHRGYVEIEQIVGTSTSIWNLEVTQ